MKRSGPVAVASIGLLVAVGLTGCSRGAPREASSSSTSSPVATTSAVTELPSSSVPPVLPAISASVPEAYELTYRVERFRTDGEAIDTEIVRTDGPFAALVVSRSGEPGSWATGDATEYLEVLGGTESGTTSETTGTDRILFAVVPAPAARGAAIRSDLVAAGDAELAQPVGAIRTILRRQCTVVRLGSGTADGATFTVPTEHDHVEVCVDADGVVLQRVDVVAGTMISRRTAVALVEEPTFAPASFAPRGNRLPEEQGGGRVRRVTDESRPPGERHFELATSPPGFEHVGRFGVATDTTTQPSAAGAIDRLVSIVDVYRRGMDVITIENGGTESGRPYFAAGSPLDVEGLQRASVLFRFSGTEIRALFDGGRYLRITGTVALVDLVAIASELVVVDGPGTVKPFDDDPDVAVD